MYEISGRSALITGAGLGIGRSIALRLAAEGVNLALFDLHESALGETAGLARSAGVKVAAHVVDVSDAAAVDTATADAGTTLGGFDYLVNNAAISHRNSIIEADAEHFGKVMSVNVWGVFNCSKAVLPGMLKAGRGSIVNISSWAGKTALPQYFAYCTSKFAVIGMTQAMAVDLGQHGIRVNAVCPGIIMNTPTRDMAEAEARARGLPPASERAKTVPMRRLGEPEDVANCVAFLLSDQADYLTGQSINATGGLWTN
ncbi:SDR family NAD(P)-dependent oxidoreductase [Rhodoligotrophos defluvii]|uniref:SDR family NAD(P)-dependent oxidoreductase n=1 Tax=Rhodoligotrophos defluvii TaxID=2561934 RepID=UPI0010C9D1CF|nr:SDR family NAD(P)-dependent oxidoreductase [Rhodoligotrophos defluvii]